jgi:predicted phage-related endonuclease
MMEPLVVEEVEMQHEFEMYEAADWEEDVVPEGLPEWWRGEIDRGILPVTDQDLEGPGVFEAKTKGPWPFRDLKKNGISDGEKLQVMHYLGLTGWEWALYACLEPVSWQLYTRIITRDNEALDMMRVAGDRFWKEVTEGPAPYRLMPTDKRCQRCPWRWTCHGDALAEPAISEMEQMDDERLVNLISRRDSILAEEKALAELKQQNIAEIKEVLGNPRTVMCGERKILWKRTTRKQFQTSVFKKEHAEIYSQYVEEKPFETFNVY